MTPVSYILVISTKKSNVIMILQILLAVQIKRTIFDRWPLSTATSCSPGKNELSATLFREELELIGEYLSRR